MKKIILLPILIIFVIGCAKQIETPIEEPRQQLPTAKEKEIAGGISKEDVKETQETGTKDIQKLVIPGEKPQEIQTNWPSFHGDNARTGFSTSKAPSKQNVLWKWTFGDFMKSETRSFLDGNWPIINGGRAFFPLEEEILAIDLKTGKKLWSYFDEDADFYPRGLSAGNGKIFASVNRGDNLKTLPHGFIYSLEEDTGKLLWKYQTQKGISHSLPLFAGNKVFVGDDSGNIYALDANGALIWKKYLNAEVIHSSPAFDNGKVFVGTEGSGRSNAMPSRLYALDAETGKEIWSFQVDFIPGKLNLIHATPAISDEVVYFGAENGYFYAVSADNGSLVWKQKIASGPAELIGVSAAAALGYGKAFIGTYEGKFLALEQKDGRIVWEYDFGKGNADSSPVLADGKVYFGVGEGGNEFFYSFNAGNGEVIWKEKIGGSSGALASGVLVVRNALAEDNLKPETPIIIAFSDQGKLSLW